jgi:hypothetical protein
MDRDILTIHQDSATRPHSGGENTETPDKHHIESRSLSSRFPDPNTPTFCLFYRLDDGSAWLVKESASLFELYAHVADHAHDSDDWSVICFVWQKERDQTRLSDELTVAPCEEQDENLDAACQWLKSLRLTRILANDSTAMLPILPYTREIVRWSVPKSSTEGATAPKSKHRVAMVSFTRSPQGWPKCGLDQIHELHDAYQLLQDIRSRFQQGESAKTRFSMKTFLYETSRLPHSPFSPEDLSMVQKWNPETSWKQLVSYFVQTTSLKTMVQKARLIHACIHA